MSDSGNATKRALGRQTEKPKRATEPTTATAAAGGGVPGVPVHSRESEPSVLEYHKTTLGALGLRLPIGVLKEGRYERDFTVRPFKTKFEKEINELRRTERALTLGRMVAEVVAVMCPTIGHHSLEGMKRSAALNLIGQMHMMDVLYVYVMIREASLGHNLEMTLTCPNCRNQMDVITDLRDLDVLTLDDEEEVDQSFYCKLDNPTELRGVEVKGFHCGPLVWNVFDSPGFEGGFNPTMRDLAMMRGSVCRASGIDGNIVLTEEEMDELTVRDKVKLTAMIDDRMPGPQMAIEMNCKACAADSIQPIEWTYDVFFGRFFQPGLSTTSWRRRSR